MMMSRFMHTICLVEEEESESNSRVSSEKLLRCSMHHVEQAPSCRLLIMVAT
jgi:hypothetical protein